jgi:hypothetical protein
VDGGGLIGEFKNGLVLGGAKNLRKERPSADVRGPLVIIWKHHAAAKSGTDGAVGELVGG